MVRWVHQRHHPSADGSEVLLVGFKRRGALATLSSVGAPARGGMRLITALAALALAGVLRAVLRLATARRKGSATRKHSARQK